MTKELFWLTLTLGLTGILWIPYILDRIMVRGLMGAMANPTRNDAPHSPWAQRLLFAHDNSVENLVVFAGLVFVLAELDRATTATALACAAFFWSRLAYVIVYTLGVPVLRTLCFAIGFIAQAVLFLAVFGKM